MVWTIALPMVISNVTIPLLGLVDTVVVGHLDSELYLAAVAVGASIFSFLFLGFNFLRMGTTGFTAQAFGADNVAEQHDVLLRAMILALGIGLLLIFLKNPLINIALGAIKPETAVAGITRDYFSIRILAAPASLMNVVFIGWFIGQQNTRVPLALMVLINAVNIVLDVIFVMHLELRANGVALASLIAEYLGVVVGMWLALRTIQSSGRKLAFTTIWDVAKFRALMGTNIDLWIRTLALQFAFILMTAIGARLGSTVLAANAILLNFQHILSYALDGFANAAEALTGRAIGAGELGALDQAVSLSRYWSVVIALALMLMFVFFGHLLIDFMTTIADVRELAKLYIPWLILSPVISTWCFLYDGVFVGAMRSREMRDIMLLSTFGVFVPACALVLVIGNHGLWLAFLIFMGARGLFMFQKWKSIRAAM